MNFNMMDDEEWERWERREDKRPKWRKRILSSAAVLLLLAYTVYTFPRDIRSVAGVRGGVTAVTVSMEAWDPAKGLKDSTMPFETIVYTAEPKGVSEFLDIFDDYRFRKKLSHRLENYYEKTTELDVALRGSDGMWKHFMLASDGNFYTMQPGRNDYYHIGLAGSGRAVELFGRLTDYVKEHPIRNDVRLSDSDGIRKSFPIKSGLFLSDTLTSNL